MRPKYARKIKKSEIDFIHYARNRIYSIEVSCSKMKRPELGRSFYNFIKKYKTERGLILTKGSWDISRIENTEILFNPAWLF